MILRQIKNAKMTKKLVDLNGGFWHTSKWRKSRLSANLPYYYYKCSKKVEIKDDSF